MSAPPAKPKGSALSPVIVNACQRGNPLLRQIKNVPWEFGETLADYTVGQKNCVLYLSLKYHKLHPNYIYERLKILGKAFLCRFLLVQVDTKDHTKVLRELTRISFLLNFTLLLAWSIEEAGRYIETLKAYETKTPDSIKEKPAESDAERVTRALTSIKGVNSTDAYTMALNFKTFADIANADKGSLQMCPGLGAQKIRRILEAFDEPFKRDHHTILAWGGGLCSKMVMSMEDSTVVLYASWLATRSTPATDADLFYIIRRLGMTGMEDIDELVKRESFEQAFPLFDQRKVETFMAAAKYLILSEGPAEARFIALLAWSLKHIPEWNVSKFNKKHFLTSQWTFAILKASSTNADLKGSSSKDISDVLGKYCSAIVQNTSDLEECSKAISGILEGLLLSSAYIDASLVNSLLRSCYDLLQSGIFDLGEFLKDCPPGSSVDEILQRHYFLLKSILTFISAVLTRAGKEVDEELYSGLRSILLGYFREATQFLLHTSSEEPFLFEAVKDIGEIAAYRGNREIGEFMISLLQVVSAGGPMNQFIQAIDSCCLNLYCSVAQEPGLRMEAVKSLRMVLGNLSQFDSPGSVIATVGLYIGRVLKLFLAEENLVFSESFVTNLTLDLPAEGFEAEASPTLSGIIKALGNISIGVEDEKISRICLSTLIAQFKKNNSGLADVFFEQFNLIASSGSTSFLSSVLDIYIGRYMEAESQKQLSALSSAMQALTVLVEKDALKLEIMLQSVMRLFVDKGLALVKAFYEKQQHHHQRKTTGSVMEPPVELELLLPVLEPLLASLPRDQCHNKAARLEAFQEFWFLLIFTGYQQKLAWPDTWAPFIPTIAIATPVLIKETDRLKAVTSPLSQVLLSQTVNVQIKSQLAVLMPNCTYLTKSLTLPKCLWLLAVFFSETYKLQHGILSDLMAYMTSEVVKQFDLEPFIEDLLTTVFKRWLPDASAGNQDILDRYACELLEYCGHVQERVHAFALRFLKMILDNHKQTYSCHQLWEAFLGKMMWQYEVCRRCLGEATSGPDVTADLVFTTPEQGRIAFEHLIGLARNIFAAASAEYPHDFFAFIQRVLKRHQVCQASRPGDRDIRMLELLRICLPLGSDSASGYLGLPLEFQGKPEDYIKWLLRRDDQFIECAQGALSRISYAFIYEGVGRLGDLIRFPFTNGQAQDFREAVYCWAWILDEKPGLLGQVLTLIHHAWGLHVTSGVGPFGQAAPLGVFSGKMDTGETLIRHLIPQSSPSIPYMILVDFLHERLLLIARNHGSKVRIFYSLLVSMLRDMRRLAGHPRLRPALFKVVILSFEFLRQTANGNSEAPSSCQSVLRSHLYTLLLEHYSVADVNFAVEDSDFMRYEEGLLFKLRSWFDEERNSSRSVGPLDGRLLLPEPVVLRESASLLHLLLSQDWERIMIWNNRMKVRQTYISADLLVEKLEAALKYSLGLALRLLERFPYIPRDASIIGLFERNRAHVRLEHPDTCAFWLQNRLELGTPYALLTAPPLPIITAISLFRQPGVSPALVNYAMRSLEVIKPELLYFYIPHIVQTLRHDTLGYIERTIMHVARTSSLFAHQIIWNMKANTHQDDQGLVPDPMKDRFEAMIAIVSRLLAGIDKEFFEREFAFFDKVTAISGALKPYVKKEKWEKKAKIDEELRKIEVDPGVYLPSNPESIVLDIDYDSGRPLQSHAKAPYMATFRVRSNLDPEAPPIWQSVIFKVGDDCRQDLLALQFLTALKNLFNNVGLNLYFFPYRVIATGPGCGVIEVIPNSISRDQLGREKINSLYDYFRFKFGNERSPKFAQARENFVKSMAAYSVACYLLAIRDRHNGNIMVSDAGHIIHIDFGFILDLSPGGISVESPFKLTTEMLAVMGGREDAAPYYAWFRELCCQAFLALRPHAESLLQLVETMSESGLPCFARGETVLRKLRGRFRLDLNDGDARQFFYDLVYKSCETIRTALYDKYQEKTNGIPY